MQLDVIPDNIERMRNQSKIILLLEVHDTVKEHTAVDNCMRQHMGFPEKWHRSNVL